MFAVYFSKRGFVRAFGAIGFIHLTSRDFKAAGTDMRCARRADAAKPAAGIWNRRARDSM